MEQRLDQLVEKLKDAAEENLQAVVLYGSAVRGEFVPGRSNVNLLCLLRRAEIADLESLHPVVDWWVRKGNTPPVVMTTEELRRTADIFAMELLDIQTNHRMLFGENTFSDITIPKRAYQWQVERELRANWLRLRQSILAAPRRKKVLLGLMTGSVSTFVALFRHALLAMGLPVPDNRGEVLSRIAETVVGEPSVFQDVLAVREGKKRAWALDIEDAVGSYLEFVALVADEVDRRLAGGSA